MAEAHVTYAPPVPVEPTPVSVTLTLTIDEAFAVHDALGKLDEKSAPNTLEPYMALYRATTGIAR